MKRLIQSVHIRNFKGLQNIQLDGVSRINVIGGNNNVGKSSVLEAIFLLYTALGRQLMIRQQLGLRNMVERAAGQEKDWAMLVYDMDEQRKIEIEVQSSSMKRSLTCEISSTDDSLMPDEAILPQLNNNPLSVMHILYQTDQGGIYQGDIFSNNQYVEKKREGNLQFPNVYILRSSVLTNHQINALANLDQANQMGMVLGILRLIEPSIRGLSILPTGNGNEIYADVGLPRKLPLKMLGDGMGHVLSFILAMVIAKNGILLIDEIENGIYHQMQTKLWQQIDFLSQRFDCQVFATTHSYECLQALYQATESSKELSYFRLEKNREQEVFVEPYSREELGQALAMNWEVR